MNHINWKKIEITGKTYLANCAVGSSDVQFYMSDFLRLWKEIRTVSEVLARAREQNARIEYDNNTILSTLATKPEQITFENSDESNELVFKYYVSKRPFNYKWRLRLCDQMEYMDVITKPLLLSVSSLAKQNSMLLDIVKKKDIEIGQYELEGVQLKRYKLITPKFNEDDFKQSIRFKPVAEFVAFADDKYDDFIQVTASSEDLQTRMEKTPPRQNVTSKIAKKSPKGKKSSGYRTHIINMQQQLDMQNKKVNYDNDDSDSSTSAVDDTETRTTPKHTNKHQDITSIPSTSAISTQSKKLKLSRKSLNL